MNYLVVIKEEVVSLYKGQGTVVVWVLDHQSKAKAYLDFQVLVVEVESVGQVVVLCLLEDRV